MPSLWRPFSFFRAMVRRPFLERMRTRKPCVWCLFTVDGWYVRFTASIGAAAKEEREEEKKKKKRGQSRERLVAPHGGTRMWWRT